MKVFSTTKIMGDCMGLMFVDQLREVIKMGTQYFVCSRSGPDSKDQETEIQRRRTVSRKFECPVELF